jgi:hypothetical protein
MLKTCYNNMLKHVTKTCYNNMLKTCYNNMLKLGNNGHGSAEVMWEQGVDFNCTVT